MEVNVYIEIHSKPINSSTDILPKTTKVNLIMVALKEKSGDQAKNSSFVVKIYHLGNRNVKISYTQRAA